MTRIPSFCFKLLAAALLVQSTFVLPARTQGFNTGGGGGGAGGGVSISSGCGTVANPDPLTNTGTISRNLPLTASSPVTTTPYTIQASDTCNLLLLESGASVLTLPNAATGGFEANKYWIIDNQSGGDITINVDSPSNIDGSASITIVAGTAMSFQSDGNNYHFVVRSAPGIGTVTSFTGDCGIETSPSPLVNAGIVRGKIPPTIISTPNPPITSPYCGGVIYFDGGSDLSPTIAQAGSAGFQLGFNVTLCSITVAQTITVAGGTIGGLGSYTLGVGTPTNPVCVSIISDGASDYKLVAGASGSVTQVLAGCGSSINGGAITTTGAIYSTNISLGHINGDTISGSECGKLATYASGSAVGITLPQAGSAGFAAGWYEDHVNYGAGAVTFTVSVGTFLTTGTPTTYVLNQGQGVRFTSSTLQAGGWDVSNTGGTSGGLVSATSNSDGTLTISPTTGAVVASLALGHANTWTGAQTFAEVLGKVQTPRAGTTDTLAAADCGTEVVYTAATAVTVTIPTTLPVGCNIALLQAGNGQVAVNGSAVTPATLHSSHSYTKTFGLWAIIGINIYTSGVAILSGDGA